jgi:hypothetical protein
MQAGCLHYNRRTPMTNANIFRIACLSAMALGLAVAATASAQQIYAPPPVGVRVYGYVAYPAAYPYAYYGPRRALRQAVRYGYAPLPAAVVVVRPPTDFLAAPSYRFPYYGSPYYGYPYYGVLKPPIGYGSTIGPNGSTYPLGYGQPNQGTYRAGPPSAAQIPPPPDPQTPSSPAPGFAPPQPPTQEPIPAPPGELGPREF